VNYKIKNQISISCILLSVFLLGCQKQNTSNTPEKVQEQIVQSQISASEVAIPTTVSNCDQVDAKIAVLKKTYDAKMLVELNELFKTCLASVPLEKRYEWFEATKTIYEFQIENLPKKLQYYIRQMDEKNSLSDIQLEKLYNSMSPSEKYVIDHIDQIYFYQYYQGEGSYDIALNPEYVIKIFSPSLQKSDQIYLKEYRNQENTIGGSIDNDAGLTVSFTQLGDWIIFWENYIKQYPQSHFKNMTQKHIQFYQKYLFLGLENTPVFEFEYLDFEINPDALKAITKISKTQSQSAEKAKKILDYVTSSKKMDASFNEETDSQAEYNAYLYQQEEFINTFQKNYQQQLITLLNLE